MNLRPLERLGKTVVEGLRRNVFVGILYVGTYGVIAYRRGV
jgi:hypothetical protein